MSIKHDLWAEEIALRKNFEYFFFEINFENIIKIFYSLTEERKKERKKRRLMVEFCNLFLKYLKPETAQKGNNHFDFKSENCN